VTDENTAQENGEGPLTLPPKIFDQLGVDVLSAAAIAREPGPPEPHRPKPPKRKVKVSTLLWLLIVISAVVFAFFFFGEPIKGRSNKSAGDPAEVAPAVFSSAPILPMKPRLSTPVPTDAEIDAAPVPPAGNDLIAPLDKI